MPVAVASPLSRPDLLGLENFWPEQGNWTYEDYCRLPNNGWKYEVIEGELYMSPAPRPIHQYCIVNLSTALKIFGKKHKAGNVLIAPLDVRLPGKADPVQPDVVFVLKNNLKIVKDDYIVGVPDFIAEVLSPGNWLLDRGKKFEVYAKAGIKEYWIIDPRVQTVEQFVLRKKVYELVGKYGEGETTSSEVIKGFRIRVDEVFEVFKP